MKIEDETGVSNGDDKVARLPVRFKEPPDPERVLLRPHEVSKARKCDHLMAQYLIDPSEAEVTCGRCGGKLNPMWVLNQLAVADYRYAENRRLAKEAHARLDERKRCQCQHCGKMTRIKHI